MNGIDALFKSEDPDWSHATNNSVIMSTGGQSNLKGQLILDERKLLAYTFFLLVSVM